MKLTMIGVAAIALFSAAPAFADCPVLPNQITNGQTADGTKVMGDLNQLRDCLNGQVGSIAVPSVTITNSNGGPITLKNPTATAPYDLNLPAGPGTSGQVLVSGGAGMPMSWSAFPVTAKVPLMDGYPVLRPAASSLSWGNQGTLSLVDHPNGPLTVIVTGIGNTDQLHALYSPVPSSAPFTTTVKMDCAISQTNSFCGALIMNGTTQSYRGVGHSNTTNSVNHYSIIRGTGLSGGPGSFVDIYLTGNISWFRIYDDGTSLYYYLSSNGSDWIQVYTELLSATGIGTVTVGGVAFENYGTRTYTAPIFSLENIAGTGTNSSW